MADEQQPPQQAAPAPAAPTFLEKLQMDPASLWKDYKTFFIIFGVLILVIKFREVIIDILVSNSKTVLNDAKKQDGQMRAEENKDNAAANQLVDEAKQLGENKPEVPDDWFKKK